MKGVASSSRRECPLPERALSCVQPGDCRDWLTVNVTVHQPQRHVAACCRIRWPVRPASTILIGVSKCRKGNPVCHHAVREIAFVRRKRATPPCIRRAERVRALLAPEDKVYLKKSSARGCRPLCAPEDVTLPSPSCTRRLPAGVCAYAKCTKEGRTNAKATVGRTSEPCVAHCRDAGVCVPETTSSSTPESQPTPPSSTVLGLQCTSM